MYIPHFQVGPTQPSLEPKTGREVKCHLIRPLPPPRGQWQQGRRSQGVQVMEGKKRRSGLITAVISCGKQSRLPASSCFSAERVRDDQTKLERERETNSKKEKETENKIKRESEDEKLVFLNPRWFVMLEVRHISPRLPAALQECELLQQESASGTSPPL